MYSPKQQAMLTNNVTITGKTKLLTSRVAHLLLTQNVQPHQLIVTTFTRKAAQEMKERLALLLEGSQIDVSKLRMGTFHSICIRLLRKYSGDMDLDPRFTVASNKDVDDIVDALIGNLPGLELPEKADDVIRDDQGRLSKSKIKRAISHLKSKALDIKAYMESDKHDKDLLTVYEEYDKRMKRQSMLDFDDILLLSLKLLRKRKCLFGIKHVLVDEFQDTNHIQLELINEFSHQNEAFRDNITVVGDPDQSIYAFRGAVSENFEFMKKMYPSCTAVYLRENYRSTQDVLDASELIMKDQQDRDSKLLRSQYKDSFKIVYRNFANDFLEAKFIAKEVEHVISMKLVDENDICILVRSNYMTRIIEKELNNCRIKYSIVKGRAFWERKEISLLVDRLRVVVRPHDSCALLRVLGSHTGIGLMSVKKIGKLIDELHGTNEPLRILQDISCGNLRLEKLQTKVINTCKELYEEIRDCQKIYNRELSDRSSLLRLFDRVSQQQAIQKLVTDDEEKRNNLSEVRKYLEIFEPDDIDQEVEELTLLEHFLNSIDIYSPEEMDDDDRKKTNEPSRKVSISTIHSAKGLEWKVVFVAGLTQGKFPSSHIDPLVESPVKKVCEERRVLYVAMTRAQQLLYVTSASETSVLVKRLTDNTGIATQRQISLSTTEKLEKLARQIGTVVESCESHVQKYLSLHPVVTPQDRYYNKIQTIDKAPSIENRISYAGGKGPKVPSDFKLGRYGYPRIVTKRAVSRIGMPEYPIPDNAPPVLAPTSKSLNLPAQAPKRRKTLGVRRRKP